MNSKTVDLIATDPPFNKGKDFHATPDSLASGATFQDRWSWKNDVHEEWTDEIKDDWPAVWEVLDAAKVSYGMDMAAFLCFMGVRIIEMHRVLKSTGSIYLHCDPTAGHYLKLMMDAVFGRKNFRSDIIWNGGSVSGFKSQRKGWIRQYDNILYYAKSDKFVFNKQLLPYKEDYIRKMFRKTDEFGRKYRDRGYKRFYADEGGMPISNNWIDIYSMQTTSQAKEKTGYPTQKPLALYERIVSASSNEGDIVLDPFCGCATTLIAAERLDRQWVGIDIWEKAHETVWSRLRDEYLEVEGETLKGQGLLVKNDIIYRKDVPTRTDEGEEVAPRLQTVKRVEEPKGKRMTRAEMLEYLVDQNGCKCAGCDREFDHEGYLELDHNTPRADGGINHISNRILLCSPCNRSKSHTFTLSGLRKRNRREGKMASHTLPANHLSG